MRAHGRTQAVEFGEGIVSFAFELPDCEARYLIVSCPCGAGGGDGAGAAPDFFGEDHYVEVRDQLYGRYGGIETLSIHGERELRIVLREPVPGVGSDLTIVTAEPLSEIHRTHLQPLRPPATPP